MQTSTGMHTGPLDSRCLKRREWKKRDGLLNTLEREVTEDIKVTSQTGHPFRKETVLAPSLSSPSSMQSCLFHSHQDF